MLDVMKLMRPCLVLTTFIVAAILIPSNDIVGQIPTLSAVSKPTPTPSPTPSGSETDQSSAKVNRNLVTLSVRVIDQNNRPVNDLRQDEIKVYENGVPQTIVSFSHEEAPVIYGLAIDTSGSMDTHFQQVINAAKLIISSNKRGDETFLERFISSDRVETAQDFTSNKDALMDGLNTLKIEGGQTTVIDGVYLAVDRVANYRKGADDERQRALIVITDGEDRASYYSESQLFQRLREENVQVYAIGFVKELENNTALIRNPRERAMNLLDRITSETGGYAFYPQSLSQLSEIANEIVRDLHMPYVIRYAPMNKAHDGSYRSIMVQVADAIGGKKRIASTRSGRTDLASSAGLVRTVEANNSVDQIIERANEHFRKGKINLVENKREQARDEFDKAVDEILMSGLDVRASQRLQTFYLELVERVHSEEVPLSSGGQAQQTKPQLGFRQQRTSSSSLDPLMRALPTDAESNRARTDEKIVRRANGSSAPTRFPPAYNGDDPVQAYSTLAGRKAELAKSTFETTQAFRERLNKVVSAIKIGGRSANDPFTLVTSDFDESYDADTETITIKLNMGPEPALDLPKELVESFYRPVRETHFLDEEFWSFDLQRRNSRTVGSAVGRNAVGVTARYVIKNYTTLYLAMRVASTNFDFPDGQKLTLKAIPQEARSLIGNIGIAVRGNFRFPFILEKPAGIQRATVAHREEGHHFELYLFVEPSSLYVFDRRSGEILGTLELPVAERKGVLQISTPR